MAFVDGDRWQDQLARMSPEEKRVLLDEKANKRKLNKVVDQMLNLRAEELTDRFMDATNVMLDRAIQGNVDAYKAVRDTFNIKNSNTAVNVNTQVNFQMPEFTLTSSPPTVTIEDMPSELNRKD